MCSHTISVLLAGFALALVQRAHADIAVSSNDGHTIITPGGPASSADPKPDTLSMVDLTGDLPRITATIEVPGRTALVSRDGDHMISVLHIDGEAVSLDPRPITTALKPYTLDMNKQGTLAVVANMGRGDGDIDSISLIDLTRAPLRAARTISVGALPEGVKFSADGSMLAIATQEGSTKAPTSPFRTEGGRLLLFRVNGTELTQLAEAPTGHWSQGVAFARDARTILVQLMGDAALAVFHFDGVHLTPGPLLSTGVGPAAITTSWP